LPDHWVVRELTERDYGIDLTVEIFVPGLKDKKNRDAYEASGALFHIQVKGTEKNLKPSANGNIRYTIKKDTLRYVEKFNVPFLLFRTDVSRPNGKIYFLWMQRYIRDVLDVRSPSWREAPEESIALYLPVKNEVSTRLDRIETIALRPKYLEELVEYREIFQDLHSRLSAMYAGKHKVSEKILGDLKSQAQRMRRLPVLLKHNDCCVSVATIDEFVEYLGQLKPPLNTVGAVPEYPHQYNLRLLADGLEGFSLVDQFVHENEGATVY
jgi:hypothetical protein